jgi:long-chain acyl-CoA synthetase
MFAPARAWRAGRTSSATVHRDELESRGAEIMRTFADPLRRAMTVAARRDAVVDGGRRLTYHDLDDRCARLVSAMHALGVEFGDRVALLMANGHRYVESYLALPAAGFVIVPLNARLSEPELLYILGDAAARVLITDRPPSPLDAAVEHVVRVPDDYDAALDAAAPAPGAERDAAAPDALAGLFYTGGTTGPAKGVMLTHANLIANTWNTLTSNGLTPADRYLVMAPMFHAAGTFAVLGCVALGATQVTVPTFDPALVLDTIEAERVTATLAVPTMLVSLCEEQDRSARDVSSLRLLAHGASPVAIETLRRCGRAFPDTALVHLYGATELAPLATAFADEHLQLDGPRAASCGQPAIGCRIRVVDTDGTPLPLGTVGEVAVRGDNVMAGYWNKSEETAAALVDGWYLTGDLGRIDDDGYLYLVDRAKDMIVTGGENVYCSEVEQALMTHPSVLECAVYAIPDERWGEAVAAAVVPRAQVSAAELQEHCRRFVAGFKVPKRVDVRNEPLPKSAAGKILKRELREPFWEGRTSRIAGS